ncbi:DNA methyltransferase [Thioclava dalianensis]|uniref:DNA methyltransferase n=1 Tax=Thioclava dalianensis TaxID=1185766 RepID=A0A074TAK7_9RHOB|nr:DNA methyltransferase [Thioclava dalianensis]
MTREWIEMRPFGGFQMIMADPPWRMETWSDRGATKKGARGQYECQGLDWIKALPVGDALAADHCVLWLWITNPMIPQGLDVLAAWGFTFKTAGHWVKRTTHGKLAFGTGYIFRCAGEPYLIGTRGKPKTSRSVRSVIEGKVREHSRKPDEAFIEAERLIPDVPRVELFSRQKRAGWVTWGNQTEKFGAQNG